MRNKVTLLNMISGLILQIFTIISGFIIPKIILAYLGSDVNGLISSLNQFLSYIALVEGGITSVVMANLYKPLVENDYEKVSSVLTTSNVFYKKIGIVFVIYTILLAFTYPFFLKTYFDYFYVTLLTIILSINLLIQYMFSLTLKTLLNSDKKGYIVNFVQAIIVIFNIIFTIISVSIYPNIHILKFISGILFAIQPVIFSVYAKKNYSINWNAKVDNTLIKERWNGFAINLAAFIHNSTDVTILTIFTNLKTVSVYSIYCLVSTGVKQLINSCLSGISHNVGHAYVKNDFEDLHRKMDIYEYIVFILVLYFFTLTALLITPFVQIYTQGIVDANYYQPLFGYLLIVSETLYLVKLPHLNLAYSANKFKEITMPAFVEAIINIVISVLFVSKFGLIGVTIGTIFGMTYRLIFHVYYTSKIVPGRKQSIFYKKLFVFAFTALIGFFICFKFIPIISATIFEWVINAFIYCLILGSMFGIVSILFFKKELHFFISYLKR